MRRCERNPQILAVFKQQQQTNTGNSLTNRESMDASKTDYSVDDPDDLIADDYSSFAEIIDEPTDGNIEDADEDEDDVDLIDETEQGSNEQT